MRIMPFHILLLIITAVFQVNLSGTSPTAAERPNIILFMTDDQGWGDVGFNGNKEINTPHLDRLCGEGARLYHFFAGGPVCSPTRGTVMTGRHYWRYGIWSANTGRLPRQEYTIARGLKDIGYTAGHFGKWHLGSPHPDYKGKGGGGKKDHLARPEWYGYDKYFVTHHAVKTWNPFGPDGSEIKTTDNPYWEDGKRVNEKLTGDDTRIIMDRVIPFIENAVRIKKPFLTVIWSHTPHKRLEAGPEYGKMYEKKGFNKQKVNYYGAITALDDQVGRLDKKLKELGIKDNTIFWFSSDNGPASHVRDGGTGGTGKMRGKKAYLFNGGVCVPAFMVWPGRVPAGIIVKTPLSTLDQLPTIFGITGARVPDSRPIDGENVLDIIAGKRKDRKKPIPFRSNHDSNNPVLALIAGKFKYYSNFDTEETEGDLLYNFFEDRKESDNLAGRMKERAGTMRKTILAYLQSFRASQEGADYPEDSGYKRIGKEPKMPNRAWSMENKKKKGKKDRGKNKKKKKRKKSKNSTEP